MMNRNKDSELMQSLKRISVLVPDPDEGYTEKFLRELREKYLIIYDGIGRHAVKIRPRGKEMNPTFEILCEDDGHIFSCNGLMDFDMYWTDDLIRQLENARIYWEEIREDYYNGKFDL